MNRREFFGWMGKVAAGVGLTCLLGYSGEPMPEQSQPPSAPDFRMRMDGSACRDFRIISGELPAVLHREISG
jgi:hypothetical protein